MERVWIRDGERKQNKMVYAVKMEKSEKMGDMEKKRRSQVR